MRPQNACGFTMARNLNETHSHSPFRQHKTRDKHEIDRMTMTMSIEMPDAFSIELRSLLTGLLQRDVHKRLGCRGRGADELKSHPFFRGIDWRVVYLQRLAPPLIPARGEVNAADAFDIGSFDDEDTKHIKLTEADQELYRNFPVVVSERWQHEIAETIFDYINHEADKAEMKRKNKNKLGYRDEEQSDCILHGYVKRLGGTFTATWLTRYVRLYPNRLELWSDSGKQPELIFMDQMEEVCNDFVLIKNEQCIVIKLYNHSKYVLTNSDEIGLKEWHLSLKAAHRESMDMMTTMAEKATKIYGTEIPLKHMGKRRQQLQQEAGGPGAPTGPFGGLGAISSTAALNWEQKIIQKELQASSTSGATSSSSASNANKPANLTANNVTATSQVVAAPNVHANATSEATTPSQVDKSQPATCGKELPAAVASAPPAGHQHHHQHHHHHHHHHHQKSVDSTGQAGSLQTPAAPSAGAGQTQKHHRAHHHSAHRAHHHHRHHHHHHHEQTGATAAATAAGQTSQTTPIGGGSTSSGHHHHHHHGHHHHRSVEKQQSAGQRRARPAAEASKQSSVEWQPAGGRPVATAATAAATLAAAATTVPGLKRLEDANHLPEARRASDQLNKSAANTLATNATGHEPRQTGEKSQELAGPIKRLEVEKGQDVEEVEKRRGADKRQAELATSRTVKEDQENLLSSSSSVASNSASDSSESSCSSESEESAQAELQPSQAETGRQEEKVPVEPAQADKPAAGSERPKLAVSLENVSDQQEVLKDPSKRITSDNKQREQDLVAQYEKLNINSRNSSSSIENDEQQHQRAS